MNANDAGTSASEPMFQLASVSEQFANNNVYAEADASFASSTPPSHVAFMNNMMNNRGNESSQNENDRGQTSITDASANIPSVDTSSVSPQEKKRKKSVTAQKQHQLPMFLTSE